MKNYLRVSTGLIALSLLTACGESFSASYNGDAEVPRSTCTGIRAADYYVEVKAQVSGDEIEIRITTLQDKETQQSDFNYYNVVNTPATATLENDTSFYVDQSTFSNSDDSYVYLSGSISEARDEIVGLQYVFVGTRSDGTKCEFVLAANKLRIMNQ